VNINVFAQLHDTLVSILSYQVFSKPYNQLYLKQYLEAGDIMVPACADKPYEPEGETEQDVHYVKLQMGNDGCAQITTNWSTLMTTSRMSVDDMAVFELEPDEKEVLFSHLLSNVPIGKPVKC
jgi:hypothetical protein